MMNAAPTFAQRWNVWTQRSANRKIFAAILTVGSLTFIVKLAATVKELFVAHRFGTSDTLDAFLIALVLPSFLSNVLAASFNPALIPTYVEVYERAGKAEAQKLFANVMLLCMLFLGAATMLLVIFTSPLLAMIASGFSAEKLALTRALYFALLPYLFVSGVSVIWSAILNARGRFALAAIAPIVTPVLTMTLLLTVVKRWNIYAVVAGTVGGILLETLVLGWSLRRHGFSLLPRWHGMSAATKQVLQQYAPVIAGGLVMNCTTLVDQAMATTLGSGSVAVLNYANKIIAFTLGVATMALGAAVLPHFSRMAAAGDRAGIRHTLRTYSRLILAASSAVTIVFIALSEPLVRLLFQRGAFTAADTGVVAKTQIFYLLQVPFYVTSIMIVRLISSLKANRILLWGAVISLILKVALNYVFMQRFGVGGIALSTSVVYVISFGFLAAALGRLLKESS